MKLIFRARAIRFLTGRTTQTERHILVSEDGWFLADLNHFMPDEAAVHNFIKSSPEIVADLLAENERLETELEALRGELRELFGLDWREGINQFREVMEKA